MVISQRKQYCNSATEYHPLCGVKCVFCFTPLSNYRCNVLGAVPKRLFKQCGLTKQFAFCTVYNTGVSAAGVHLTPSSRTPADMQFDDKSEKNSAHMAKKEKKLERRSLCSKVVCGKASDIPVKSPRLNAHRRWSTFLSPPPPILPRGHTGSSSYFRTQGQEKKAFFTLFCSGKGDMMKSLLVSSCPRRRRRRR